MPGGGAKHGTIHQFLSMKGQNFEPYSMIAMAERAMPLSKRSIEMLLDLVEIKLGCLEVCDREDEREHSILERCLKELTEYKALATKGVTRIEKARKVA